MNKLVLVILLTVFACYTVTDGGCPPKPDFSRDPSNLTIFEKYCLKHGSAPYPDDCQTYHICFSEMINFGCCGRNLYFDVNTAQCLGHDKAKCFTMDMMPKYNESESEPKRID